MRQKKNKLSVQNISMLGLNLIYCNEFLTLRHLLCSRLLDRIEKFFGGLKTAPQGHLGNTPKTFFKFKLVKHNYFTYLRADV